MVFASLRSTFNVPHLHALWLLLLFVCVGQAGAQTIAGQAGATITPIKHRSNYEAVAPAADAARLQSIGAAMERSDRANAGLYPPMAQPVAVPQENDPNSQTGGGTPPNVPGNTWTSVSSGAFLVTPSGGTSSIMEPAHATNGKKIFMTGNWFAARSLDAGATWAYINPYDDLASFCCDQDVVWDEGRQLLIWFRQGSANASGNNTVRLSVSTNFGDSWCSYNFGGSDINAAWANNWFDYPRLALSNNYLYYATNMFNSADVWQREALLRFPLDTLQACTPVTPNSWSDTSGATWTPVQGATTTMYLGQTTSAANTIKVWKQNGADTALTATSVSVTPWTYTDKGSATCTVANGRNPCARLDQRMTSAWLAKGKLGFFWNVKQGGAHPYPYIDAALLDESTLALQSRPFIWNPDFAFIYGEGTPNARGDLGVTMFLAGGTVGYPRINVAIWDDYVAPPPGWDNTHVESSTNWAHDRAGDYLRVRRHSPANMVWTASSYVNKPGAGADPATSYKQRIVAFGRERDLREHQKWYNK